MTEKTSSSSHLDWRYRVVTTLAEYFESPWTGILHKKGSPLSLQTFVKHGEQRIQIGDPSAPALFLNQSYKAYSQANEIHPFGKGKIEGREVGPSNQVYDYLELVMASIIFSYTALESFTNEEIPADFEYEKKRPKSNLVVVLRKVNIERQISLNEKLSLILPKVTGRPSPSGLRIWKKFVELSDLRNRIIHMKSSDRIPSKDDDLYPASIWSKLLEPNQPNYPRIAKRIMLHFKDIEKTHWLKYCPFS